MDLISRLLQVFMISVMMMMCRVLKYGGVIHLKSASIVAIACLLYSVTQDNALKFEVVKSSITLTQPPDVP